MGMTIDRAIKRLKGQQADFNEQYIDMNGSINDAFNTAYEVMRKYQKIEQIYKDYCFPTKFVNTFDAMEMIGEVLKDGNDD